MEQTKSAPPPFPTWTRDRSFLPNSNLTLEVTGKSQRRILGELRDAAPGGVFPGPMYVCTRVLGAGCCVRGRCSQIPPPSPSCLSLSVALRAPGGSGGVSIPALCGWRGYQSGQDPENPPHTYPTLRHPCHTAVDMLSPGDMPSSMGCSVDCGLEAERLTVGG